MQLELKERDDSEELGPALGAVEAQRQMTRARGICAVIVLIVVVAAGGLGWQEGDLYLSSDESNTELDLSPS